MNRAKGSARAAGTAAQRSASFREAAAAERAAIRLFDAGRLAEATPRFYEAAGLYRSAEVSATIASSERQPPAAPPAGASKDAKPVPAPAPAPTLPPQEQSRPLPDPPAQQPAGPLPGSAGPLPVPPVAKPDAPPSPPPAKNPEPPAAAHEEGVRDLVRRYEQALESRSIDALKKLWPSLSGAQEDAMRNEFLHARRIDVDVTITDVAVSGTTATATFVRRYQLSTVDGQQLLRNSRTTLSARRAGSDWVIDRMRFEALQ